MKFSLTNGRGFLEGFEDGVFSGALSGAICGAAFAGLGQLGAVCGRSIKCASSFGKAIQGTAAVTKGISIAMGGFDTLAAGAGFDVYFPTKMIYDTISMQGQCIISIFGSSLRIKIGLVFFSTSILCGYIIQNRMKNVFEG